MQKKLYRQLVILANIVSFVSLTGILPQWLVIPAGIVCFIDFTITQMK